MNGICNCQDKYTVEPHGGDLVVYYGRCNHRHGMNLAYITEIDQSFRCILEMLLRERNEKMAANEEKTDTTKPVGYHITNINKGKLGEFSKIEEEYTELLDAEIQKNPILALVECSDLIGAIESYTVNKFNVTIDDLIKMKDSTKRAFETGAR